jgi:hypothetical protein
VQQLTQLLGDHDPDPAVVTATAWHVGCLSKPPGKHAAACKWLENVLGPTACIVTAVSLGQSDQRVEKAHGLKHRLRAAANLGW